MSYILGGSKKTSQMGGGATTSPGEGNKSRQKFGAASSTTTSFVLHDLPRAQLHFPIRYKTTLLPVEQEQELNFIRSVFKSSSLGGLTRTYFHKLMNKLCKFPEFMTSLLYKEVIALGKEMGETKRLVSGHAADMRQSHLPAQRYVWLVTERPFLVWWKQHFQQYTEDTRFFNALKTKSHSYLTAADLRPFLVKLIKTCPSTDFLSETPVFQDRFIDTILSSILYYNDRCQDGCINFTQFRKSGLVEIFKTIEAEPDINSIPRYFSYKQFYVIYRKFWELDTDHDLLLSIGDLSRYGNGALSTRTLKGIFQNLPGPVFDPPPAHRPVSIETPPSPSPSQQRASHSPDSSRNIIMTLTVPQPRDRWRRNTPPSSSASASASTSSSSSSNSNSLVRTPVVKLSQKRMTFTQFVWFILSEEDKSTPQSWRYWFNILDRDFDGLVTPFDIEYFYEEQMQRQRTNAMMSEPDIIPFHDILLQAIDAHSGSIHISFLDLKKSGHAEALFNTLFNLNKFLANEHANPFDHLRRDPSLTPWQQFSAHEYTIAALQESAPPSSDSPSHSEEFDSSSTHSDISDTPSNEHSSDSDSASDSDLFSSSDDSDESTLFTDDPLSPSFDPSRFSDEEIVRLNLLYRNHQPQSMYHSRSPKHINQPHSPKERSRYTKI